MVKYRDDALMRKLNQSYRNLQTSAQDNRARALLEASTLTKHQRDEFAREVWEAVNLKHAKISHITEATGAARTTIYKVIKDYEDNNKNLTSLTAMTRYSIGHRYSNAHLIKPIDGRGPETSWEMILTIQNGGWSWGMESGKGDFFAELNDPMTGLKDLVQKYIDDNIGTGVGPRALDD